MTPDPDHYFTSPDSTPQKIKKIFLSVANQTLSLQTAAKVFSPDGLDKGTEILLENMLFLPPEKTNNILDLGTGYGPIAIWLYKKYSMEYQLNFTSIPMPRIYASEINSRAIWLLNRNLLANNCKDIEVLKGDFASYATWLKDHAILFDAIYTNPPLKVGHNKLLELFEVAMDSLQPHGFIQYVHKKRLGAPGFLKKLKELRPSWKSGIYKKSGGYHVIVVAPEELPYQEESSRLTGYF